LNTFIVNSVNSFSKSSVFHSFQCTAILVCDHSTPDSPNASRLGKSVALS
jgi:hypothetical protein